MTLPEDAERVEMLRRKLGEYEERIETYHDENQSQHPAFRALQLATTTCKMTILKQLLDEGRVVAWDASKAFIDERLEENKSSGAHFAEAWMTAFEVINDYCETGGANVGGGTGLR
ncbi:MAG: hypothetical protein KJI69_01010 [Patescibacteria group bacterium]|nr:hypothetical protein [Patescibacteria group bacterium]